MSGIRDNCRHCELRGDMARCAVTECYNHDNWYATALRAALAAAERERDEARARVHKLEQQRSDFDCRFAGAYAETSGSHCPAERPCARCEAERIEEERDEARRAHESACLLVAKMLHAATGGTDGPRIGVVEDVAALREERDRLREQLAAETDPNAPQRREPRNT